MDHDFYENTNMKAHTFSIINELVSKLWVFLLLTLKIPLGSLHVLSPQSPLAIIAFSTQL